MSRTLLVINGDDGGLHADTDEALLSCARCGLLRSVSAVANGSTTVDFVARARDLGVALGLHFNITDGAPVGGPYVTLTGDDGRFHDKLSAWGRAHALDPHEVAAEAKAQWERLRDLGAELDHVDGHNHVQVFRPVLEGLVQALGEEKLVMRVPDEPENAAARPSFPDSALAAGEMRQSIAATTWRTMDRFAGFGFCDKPELAAIAHLEERTGPTEWMVHPGRRPGSAFTVDERRGLEIDFLCNDGMRTLLDSWGYRCGTFAEAP